MTIYTRPDEHVFASAAQPGEVEDYPDILRGWGITFEQTEGKPPMEWMNGAMRRIDEAIRYLTQRGIPEWSPSEDYPVGAYIQHNGATYRSLEANKEVEPGTDDEKWLEWGITRTEFADVAFSGKFPDLKDVPHAREILPGIVQLATAEETLEGVSKELAVHPAGLAAAFVAALPLSKLYFMGQN